MHIQWFPGHMAKAKKDIKDVLSKIDVVIELMDARLPQTSSNPMLAHLRRNKPCLKLMSKADLADEEITQKWVAVFEQEQGVKAQPICIHNSAMVKQIPNLCKALVPQRSKAVRALVAGIPNVGKSTLINALAGRKIAKTGDEPAITRGQQQVVIRDDFWIFDSPGILWPGQKDTLAGYRLAASAAIRDTAYEYEDVASYAVDYMAQRYPQQLSEQYDLNELADNAYDLLGQIAAKRGCLRKEGFDVQRVSQLFLKDLRSGKLGRVSFEEPDRNIPFRDMDTQTD